MIGKIIASANCLNKCLVLTEEGEVYDFGDNFPTEYPDSNSNLQKSKKVQEIAKKVIGVAVGDRYSLALTEDGKVFIWGDNLDADGAGRVFMRKRRNLFFSKG